MNTRRWFVLCAAMSLAPLLSARSQPELPPSTSGLELRDPMVMLFTVNAGAHAAKHGLSVEAVRTRLEPRLREAGIGRASPEAEGRLDVQVNCDSTGAFFSLEVGFHRPVTITTGSRSYRTSAITWHRSLQGSFSQQADIVLHTAERVLEDFLADHKKANPIANLRGKVSAADPKFQFVVLNIGTDTGVKPGLELEVQRDGQSIAFLRVTTVHADHAIANILQDPAPQGVLEGDTVIPRR
jgi:hypothetical protein